MIPYAKHYLDASDVKAVTEVLRKGWLSQGPKVAEFEKDFARYCGVRYAVSVSSGTAGLHLACLAAGVKKNDEVITTPLSFIATANAVRYAGAKPVFSDIDYRTLNLDFEQARKKVTTRTRAIIPVDFAGYPCKLNEFSGYFRKKGLVVIRDACHALGARDRLGRIGHSADSEMTVFSFHPVKTITTGEGGMITTNDRRYYEALLELRCHGMTRDPKKLLRPEGPWYYEMQSLGFNYRLTDLQSALGISQLKKADRFVARRRQIAALYLRLLAAADFLEMPAASLKDYLPHSSHHLFTVRLRYKRIKKTRAAYVEALRERGVGAQVHYLPIYRHPSYEAAGYRQGLCPVAEAEYEKLLSLPIFYTLKDSEVRKVAAALKDAACQK